MVYRQGQEEERIQVPVGRSTSSYRAEMAALDAALGHPPNSPTLPCPAALDAALPHPPDSPTCWKLKEVRICSDSQSALRRLNEGPAAQTDFQAESGPE